MTVLFMLDTPQPFIHAKDDAGGPILTDCKKPQSGTLKSGFKSRRAAQCVSHLARRTTVLRLGACLILSFAGLVAIDAGTGSASAAPQPPSAPSVSSNTPGNNPDNPSANSLLSTPPRSWVVDAVANEVALLHRPAPYLRYRMHVHDDRGDRVRDVIESKDGTVARLIQKDGHPLTEDEDKAERDRLNAMIASPSSFAHHIKNEDNNKKFAEDLIRLMPDAMIYTYVPGQPQPPNYSDLTIVMDYAPNPKFKPPTIPSEALQGLKGRLWLDAKTRQVVRMEGLIFQPVNLGWGMLAHIYPGGKLVLEQADAGQQRWIYTHFNEQVSIRALLMKAINVHDNIDAEQFHVMLGSISYQEAIRLLLDTPLPTR